MSIPPPPGPQQPHPAQGPSPAPDPYGPPPQGQQPYGHPYGPQPYGQPYPVWGQGYTPYNRPASVNGLAVASLVLGVLCCFPAVGAVLGVIALVQIRKKGQTGKGLAIAGTILSSLGLALWILLLATGSLSRMSEVFQESDVEGSTFSVPEGQCFNAPGKSLEGLTYDVDEVPCEGEHEGEVFGEFAMSGDTFPGDDAVSAAADEKCYPLQNAYAMDSWALPDDVDVYYFGPTRQSWLLGDRKVSCIFGNTDETGTLTGSLLAGTNAFDDDQLAFLLALDAVDETLYTEPEAYPEDDLPAYRKWAREVHDSLGEQIGELRAHSWRDDTEKSVAALIKDMEKSRGEWEKAAATDDVDTFYTHYDAGYAYVDGPTTVTARKALGLAYDPPSYDEDSGSTGDDSGSDNLDV
ncbi:DUF4190 domain-containing protein [Streptomyces sp. NPDC047072]|uniref:DUF4190 domain-containing protein n=1 Tax=Streptomyces sp. NPDC047072 TaxID=3154809 RepID=UPI00340FD326